MSPILVRPVREQLEHDRVIRLLQAKLKRKHDVAMNVGDEQTAGLKIGPGQMFPDLMLTSLDKSHRLEGLIEVETGESVNHLEAMAQWAHFGRARVPFHLYVPATAVDIARRLCVENQVSVSEIWTYHAMGDQTRFTLIQRSSPETKTVRDRPVSKRPEPPRASAQAKHARPAARLEPKPTAAAKKKTVAPKKRPAQARQSKRK